MTIEIHPSYNFPPEIWNVIPHAERRKITEERTQYSNNKRQKISAVETIPPSINLGSNQPQSAAASLSGMESINQSAGTNQYQVSSIMGGRNEQASMRNQRSNHN